MGDLSDNICGSSKKIQPGAIVMKQYFLVAKCQEPNLVMSIPQSLFNIRKQLINNIIVCITHLAVVVLLNG